MKTALLFPGQGAQRVGMGKELAFAEPAAKAVFDEANTALGFSLSKLCFEGPEDQLTLTAHTQPAILATSVAVFRVLAERGLAFDVVAGHSLGEWSALVAAGALSLADAVRLTHLRGKLMQAAVPEGIGAMAAIMGLESEALTEVCRAATEQAQPVEPANFNGGGQIVISGHVAAVERAMIGAKTAGAKRAVKLNVSAPFHCSLMTPAAEGLAAALASVTIQRASVPVLANVDATPVQEPEAIRTRLVAQVTGAVRWEQSMQWLAAQGVTRAYELGPGAVLKGLLKRIAEGIQVVSVGEPQDLLGITPERAS